jgi:hypothetical protein
LQKQHFVMKILYTWEFSRLINVVPTRYHIVGSFVICSLCIYT